MADLYRDEDQKRQTGYEAGNKRMFDEMLAIVEKKRNSPYARLLKLYGHLCSLMLLLGLAELIGALYTTLNMQPSAQKLWIWLTFALLAAVPCAAHLFSIAMLKAQHSFAAPLLGVVRQKMANHCTACLGFTASGAACWIVAAVPQLRATLDALPLGWPYLPITLVVAVILPFALWLAMVVLAWLARKDPFGP